MESHNLLMKTRPSLTACDQNNRNLTSDCMSVKLTDFWLKTLAVVLVALSSFSFGKHAVKQDVSTSMPNPQLQFLGRS